MPYYRIDVTNVNSPNHPPGWQHTEYCFAPNTDTVNLMVRKDMSRFVDPDLYTWTITETVAPPKRTRAQR